MLRQAQHERVFIFPFALSLSKGEGPVPSCALPEALPPTPPSRVPAFFVGVILCVALMLAVPAAQAKKSLVQKVEQTYKKIQDYHANFEQKTYVSLIEKEVNQAGEISFAQGGKFRLTYTDTKSGRNYVCDGKKIVVSDPYLGSREMYKVTDPNVPPEALIFLGRLGAVGKFFEVKEGDRREQLVLIPKDRNAVVQRLELVVDLKSYLVQEAKVVNISGNESTYIFKNARTNADLPGQLFSID